MQAQRRTEVNVPLPKNGVATTRRSGSRLVACLLLGALALAGPGSLAADEEPSADPVVEDELVVTASRVEQRLRDVPVAMSVLSSEELETMAAYGYGDLLRSVPGVNVAQMGAREVQVTTRSATKSLATSQLVLLDNRTVYLDFLGFVMWDLLPVDLREIAQIEVVRGPGSAVWGANALGGVVNLITKSAWEMEGTWVDLAAGNYGLRSGSLSHALAREQWGLKLSASYLEQDAFERPTGPIPGNGNPYPPFANEGTEQPKVDLRFDRNVAADQLISLRLGSAGTDGIVHSGLGPFDVDADTRLGYVHGSWTRLDLHVDVYANLLDGAATNLLTAGPDGDPLTFFYLSDVYHLGFTDTLRRAAHTVTWGANARQLEFDITIAPGEDSRTELGVFLQDEIQLSDRWKWLVGARWDEMDPISDVLSPRTSLMFAPTPEHSIRLSYNEAFRTPALIDNYLHADILGVAPLGPLGDFEFPIATRGNPNLTEERLSAWEIGWVASLGPRRAATLSVAAYRNRVEGLIDFAPIEAYDGSNPPPDWPLPPALLNLPPLAGALPAVFGYRNVGEQIDRGVELSVEYRAREFWDFGFDYTWQDETEARGVAIEEVNQPPAHRLHVSVAADFGRWYADLRAHYVDESYFADVLDSRFWGTVESQTWADLALVLRWSDSVSFDLTVGNVSDERLQQHIFGDILGRRFTGRMRLRF